MQNSIEKQQKNNNKTPAASTTLVPPNSLSLSSQVYAAAPDSTSPATSDEVDSDYPNSRYECGICISWLNEPVLTSCGHRFCKSCLNTWLQKDNQCCPMDNRKLQTEQDIFPDNFTRREIQNIKIKCTNSTLGCTFVASPLDVQRHASICTFRRQQAQSEEKCPFASVKCFFVARPETNALEQHLKDDMPHHMQLMLQAFQQTAVNTWNPQKTSNDAAGAQLTGKSNGVGNLPPPPPQYANEADEQLIEAMYQRIVKLEQRAHEQEAKIDNLNRQLLLSRQQPDPRYNNGTIIWEISNFQALLEQMRANDYGIYSRECYTSAYGYRFCARLNIKPKKEHVLSLHVHLMQSENDFHLEWPFKGRIKLCMIHPLDTNLSQHDTIMTKPEILAFHQPRERISTRGFGFVEYANIMEIMQKGFCEGDRLLLKIQINIV